MYKGKKGIELSINFIVMLIITLAVFGMGLVLANKFFGEAKNIQEELDYKTEQEILSILDSGERVSIPINQKDIRKGKSEVFGLGVLNIIGTGESFSITVLPGIYIPAGATESTRIWPTNKPSTKLEFPENEIKNNDKRVYSIPIAVPKGTPNGRYVFDVTVRCKTSNDCGDDGLYGKQKIYVTVK